jgi:phosphopantothenoylcysteine decarboxylase/phosphopantothenate--cysteine ligase
LADSLKGLRVVVASGPTREPIDAVRFLSNPSTGRMGLAVARVAAERGADALLVRGPGHLPAPDGVEVVDVMTAAEMHAAVMAAAAGAAVVVMAAAVADVRPARAAATKLPKGALPLVLELERTVDILAELGRMPRPRPLLVGFAAQTGDLDATAPAKLRRKGCDLLVANRIDEAGSGFGVDTNRAVIYDSSGGREAVPPAAAEPVTKEALAVRIWERVAMLLEEQG